LEVGRDGADLFLLRLIATAPIVDWITCSETCALFNDDVSLENINLKFQHGFYRLHLSGQDAIADRNTQTLRSSLYRGRPEAFFD